MPPGRAVMLTPALPVELADRAVTTLRLDDTPHALRALAKFVEPGDAAGALGLYEAAASRGDPEAIGRMVLRADPQDVPDWTRRLLTTGDRAAMFRAGDALPPEQGTPLLQAAADGGNAEAMASLLIRRPADEDAERLLATRDWAAVRRAGGALGGERGEALLTHAADAGDTEALEALVRGHGSDGRWDERFIAAGSDIDLWRVAVALDPADPERALRFHRAAADKGDTDSMREVVARGEPEESRANVERLVERGEWGRLEDAAARLDEEPAARIRARVAAAQAGDEAA
jgi:hypothetical protein